MSLHIPYKAFNRSQRARIGGQTLSSSATAAPAYVNVEAPRNLRDLARHTSIGGVVQAGLPLGYTSDGYLTAGGVVSKRAGSLTVDITAAYFTRASGTTGTNPVDTLAITTGAVNPRIDLILIDTATPDIVKVDGTATASADLYNRLGLTTTIAANRIPIALIFVPGGSVTNLDTATVVPLR